jgi:S1-C subfamily serine protease
MMMKKSVLTLTSLAVVAGLIVSACSVASNILPQQASNLLNVESASAQATPAPSRAPANDLLAAYEQALTDIYDKVNPSVVNIRVVQKLGALDLQEGILPGIPFELPELPFDLPGLPNQDQNPDNGETPQLPDVPQYGQGLGSGFVWDTNGHIVTNNHVVEGADKIEVIFSDGTTVSAELVGADPDSDLAVLRVDAPAGLLNPVEIADSEQVKVGQLAVAIGNPFGLDGTMTVGIVSAVGRTMAAADAQIGGSGYSIPNIIQTDAPINPGNSGGVLVNDAGQVIGVTAAIESPVRANAGIGFVIPSSIVLRVVPSLIENGSFEHPYLGISGLSLTPDLAKAMDLDESQRGALVAEVVTGGPAEKAGLRGSEKSVEIEGQSINVGGDVITAIDGEPVREMDDIIAYLGSKTVVGQEVTLTVLRDGQETSVTVTLEARPARTAEIPQESQQPAQPQGGVFLGVGGVPLTAELARSLDLPEDTRGVLVQEVSEGTPADEANLQENDVITKLDGQAIEDVQGLRDLLQQHQAGDVVTLTILRNGEEMEVQVTLAERS